MSCCCAVYKFIIGGVVRRHTVRSIEVSFCFAVYKLKIGGVVRRHTVMSIEVSCCCTVYKFNNWCSKETHSHEYRGELLLRCL